MPQLTRLFYVSRATKKGASQIITDILREARAFNAANGISGLLTFDGEHFTQVLEGPVSTLNALMQRITKDDRHEDVRVLSCEPILARYFQEWAMSYVYDMQLVDRVATLFSIVRPEPEDVSAFIEDLRDYTAKLK